MYESFKKDHFKIVVGVNFDSQMETIFAYLGQLLKNMRPKIRLTHVLEKPVGVSWIASGYGPLLYEQVIKDIFAEQITHQSLKLQELASRLSGFDEVEVNVAIGLPYEVLKADAISASASMLVIGSKISRKNFVLKGFSTSLSLMSDPWCPVMVIPDDVELQRDKERIRILYADDLRDDSLASLNVGVEMSYGFGNADFYHVHICESTKEEISKMGDKILSMMDLRIIPFDEAVYSGNFTESTIEKLKEKLNSRVGGAKLMLAGSECNYQNKIYFGSLLEQLDLAVHELKPDILIFGKHALLHRKPLGVGKLSFSSMLAYKKPIIIAPAVQNTY